MKYRESEYETFDRTMRKLLKVPHSEIKTKLDEESALKKKRKAEKKSAKKH